MKYIISNINNYNDKELIDFYNNIYPQKKKRLNKYQNIIKLKQSIVGEILLSKLLKKIYNIDYKDIKITINNDGKPFIDNHNIYFSISHSNEYVICVISSKQIGVDIEKMKDINNNVKKYFMSDNELKKFIDKNLFEIYTLKEAYIKMKGTSFLEMKENEIENIMKSHKIRFNYDIEGYIIAICEKI